MYVRHISKSYPGLQVLKDVSIDFAPGKVTCILGESGAGKTTLLNILAGLTDCEGEVGREECSYIFQRPRLVPNLTVSGNLRLVCGEEERITAMLERVGLADRALSYPTSLSGGQAQRVSIARAFLYKSSAILMDEPFSSLDLRLRADMMKAFGEIRALDGRTAVFVTHDIDEALYLSDRVVVLSHGGIVFDSPNVPPQRWGEDVPLRRRLIDVLMA